MQGVTHCAPSYLFVISVMLTLASEGVDVISTSFVLPLVIVAQADRFTAMITPPINFNFMDVPLK